MDAPHRHGESFAPHVAYTPMDTKWAQQMQAAITDGAVSQAVVDKLSHAIAATSLSEEADELMQVQLQDLAAGRLGDMLAAKQRVRITGLVGRPELNGTYAKVLCYDETRGRYAVMTEVGREQLALKRPNLTLTIESEAAAAIADAIAAGSAQQAAAAGPAPAAPAVAPAAAAPAAPAAATVPVDFSDAASALPTDHPDHLSEVATKVAYGALPAGSLAEAEAACSMRVYALAQGLKAPPREHVWLRIREALTLTLNLTFTLTLTHLGALGAWSRSSGRRG